MGEMTVAGPLRVGTPLAVLEVLDRDGFVRQSVKVMAWPLRVGRALDNDLVLDDPYTAPHHLVIGRDANGQLAVTAGDSVNGVQIEGPTGRALAAGEAVPLPAAPQDRPAQLWLGRTHLRLRLASQVLAPEQALVGARELTQGALSLAVLVLLTAAVLGFNTWLESEPDLLTKALASFAISALGIGLAWSGVWTLLSKVFTRQGHFGWHLRVMLMAVLAWQALMAGTALLAFAFSWPWLTDFNFVPAYAILGAMLYFHLQAVEPQHPRRTLGFALGSATIGVLLSVWFNLQATDRAGSELYMNHLFPPALRVAKPVEVPEFMQGVADLQSRLDAKARKPDAEE
ncbi:FHA domain-containing protein [Piscinibacter sp. HJYY11]|uniref:FHA domain-containing protein n=1 Tax=Piscinibacter sp. HJYY11 TaxID=2801333 RepID=UPI00191E24F5|nr:FHA domain-containing protein [Piscinibacter sp. HJYY11]MBL0729213.1 FHA domain-containing protein [Piscinibacter sp. HJYY11]